MGRSRCCRCGSAPFARLPEVRQFQIVHEAGVLEVRVVGATDGVATAVADALADAGAIVPEIRVTSVTELERESGPAAKLKLIVER